MGRFGIAGPPDECEEAGLSRFPVRAAMVPDVAVRRVNGLGLMAGILGALCVSFVVAWWFANGFWPGDTWTYYDAATRVLVGHHVYSLAPSDVWYADRSLSPLYGPPLVVLPWLVLASLPDAVGVLLWYLAMAACAAWAVAYVLLRSGGWAGLALVALALPIGQLVGVGNVDALVIAGLVVAWMALESGHEGTAGALVGALASLKLLPAILLVWLVAQRRWRALGAALLAGAILAGLTMAVLGPGIFVEWIRSLPVGGSPLPYVILASGVVGVLLLPRRASWALASLLMAAGSPVVTIHSWALLLAGVAPWRSR